MTLFHAYFIHTYICDVYIQNNLLFLGGRPVPIELRMRLEGSVIRRAEDYLAQRSDVGEEDTFNTAPAGSTKPVHVILNEVLVDRGPTAYVPCRT
jgi:hypothetical protein